MDSKEKTSSSDIADDLDLEPLNLDFELPPIEDSDLVGLESGSDFPSDFPSLDSDFGDLSTLDMQEGESQSGEPAYSVEDAFDVGGFPMSESSNEFGSELASNDLSSDDLSSEGLSSGDFASDEEEEPVTLTADELSDIVGADLEMETELSDFGGTEMNLGSSTDDDLELGAMPESDNASYGDLEELDLEMPEDSIQSDDLVLPDDLDMDLADISEQGFAADTAEIESGLPEIDGSFDFEPPADLAEDLSVNLSESDDEDVALSEDELDNILGDVDQGLAEPADEEHAMRDEMAHDMEDVDPLEFSDEELQREVLGDEVQMPQLSILDSDDDESITLTADELSNIVSDDLAISPSPFGSDEEVLTDDIDEMEAVQEFEGFDESGSESEELTEPSSGSDLEEAAQPSFFQEEEEGPVALTDDELADILEGTAIEEAAIDQGALEGEPEDALHEEPRAERMADELSLETGVKREELKKVIGYLDDLLGQLPEETVREFSRSEYFNLYKKVIEELGVFK